MVVDPTVLDPSLLKDLAYPLLASEFVGLLKIAAMKTWNKSFSSQRIEETLISPNTIDKVLQEKIDEYDISEIDKELSKEIQQFLQSEIAILTAQNLFTISIDNNTHDNTKEDFCRSFCEIFEEQTQNNNKIAEVIYDVLRETCIITLNKRINRRDKSSLPAHDAKQIYYQKVLQTQTLHHISQDGDSTRSLIQKEAEQTRREFNRTQRPSLEKDELEQIIEQQLQVVEELYPNDIPDVYMGLLATEVTPFRESLLNSGTLSEPFSNAGHKKPIDVSELVENEHRLILIGEAGSGKSTTLRWLTKEYGRKYREGKSNNVPLYVDLADCSPEGLFEENIFKLSKLSSEALQILINEKRLFFVFDGLDNFSGDIAGLKQFIIQSKECRIVISSRPGFSSYIESSLKWKTAHLNPLSKPKERIEFINKYLPGEENAQLRQELYNKIEKNNAKLRDLCKVPLLFYMVICVAVDHRRRNRDNLEIIPNTRTELYEYFISNLTDHALASGRIKNDIEQGGIVDQILPCLFFYMQCENSIKIKRKDAFDLNTQYKSKIGEVLAISREIGLLVERDQMLHIGLHQSFQEYYAAIRLKDLFEKDIDVTPAFTHPKWEDVVVMASEMVSDPDKFVDLIKTENLFLAAKCSKTASDETKDELLNILCNIVEETRFEFGETRAIEVIASLGPIGVEKLTQFISGSNTIINPSNVIGALMEIGSEDTASALIEFMNYIDILYEIQEAAIYALGEIGSEDTVFALAKVLKNKDNEFKIQNDAAKALGSIGSKEALPALIEVWKDKNYESWLRRCAADALGSIGSKEALPALIEVFKDESNDAEIRRCAADALGSIGSKEAASVLIEVFKNKNNDAEGRRFAALALRLHGSKEAASVLIEVFKDEDNDAEGRKYAALALGLHGSKEAASVLIEVFKDESNDAEIRSIAADALGSIGSEAAVPDLIDVLNEKNNDSKLRRCTADALGSIGSKGAASVLIEVFKDESNDAEIRSIAAATLISIGSKEAASVLIEVFKDKNNDDEGRIIAAATLISIGSKGAASVLIEVFKDKNNDAEGRSTAALALGLHGSKEAASVLIEVFKDENNDSEIRKYAALALRWIVFSKDANPVLIEFFKDKNTDFKLRKYAAFILGLQGSEDAVPVLIKVLKDKNYDSVICEHAADALDSISPKDAVPPLIGVLTNKTNYYHLRMQASSPLKKNVIIVDTELPNFLKNSNDLMVASEEYEILHRTKSKEN